MRLERQRESNLDADEVTQRNQCGRKPHGLLKGQGDFYRWDSLLIKPRPDRAGGHESLSELGAATNNGSPAHPLSCRKSSSRRTSHLLITVLISSVLNPSNFGRIAAGMAGNGQLPLAL